MIWKIFEGSLKILWGLIGLSISGIIIIYILSIPYSIFFSRTTISFGNFLISTFALIIIIILVLVIILLVLVIIEKIRKKNATCKHGIKGGETLELCGECMEEKQKEKKLLEIQRSNDERKRIIIQKADKLSLEESHRFKQFNLRNKDYLYNSSPKEFESTIAEMYRKFGFDTKLTPYSNDKGKDIILKKDGKKYLVECKKYNYNNAIGRESLQKFFAAIIEDKAERGFFVTTSYFTRTSIKYAKDIQKIELINGDKLILMMREAYPENYDSNFVRIMCRECGDIVEFIFNKNELSKSCKNGHLVQNDFDREILFPKEMMIL